MSQILFVLSSAPRTLKNNPTVKCAQITLRICTECAWQGWFLNEAAHPYYVFTRERFTIDFAAPGGPNPPLDPYSIKVILASLRSFIRSQWSLFFLSVF